MLSRKERNRATASSDTVATVVQHLSAPPTAAAEAANALLNLCYEPRNVDLAVAAGAAAALRPCLSAPCASLRANAAGAVQSIAFQKAGRAALRSVPVVPPLVELLAATEPRVASRAVGALHNLSSDSEAIRLIRRCALSLCLHVQSLGCAHLLGGIVLALLEQQQNCGCSSNGIPQLVTLLRSDAIATAASAAGTLQNVAREVASRLLICDLQCTPQLATLLSSADVTAQVCAAGALLNILGPSVSRAGAEQRHGMCTLMSLVIAMAAVHDGCFEARAPLDLA